jgi:hypothetical protein
LSRTLGSRSVSHGEGVVPAADRPEADTRVGTWVEATGGPFAALTGRVVEVGGGYQFEVEFIGRGVAVHLDHWMFRRLSQAICESPVRV